MVSPKLTKFSPILRPTSPTTMASSRAGTGGRHRRLSSAVEPFPALDSEGTASTVESVSHVPRTTLLSSSALRQEPSRPPQQQQQQQQHRQQQQQPPNSGSATDARRPLQSQSDRTDALWAEMQATLADVELSASRGTHFFGSKHGAALEELRGAQMALAQAWTRGEDGDGTGIGIGLNGGSGGATEKGVAGLGSNAGVDDDDDGMDSDRSPGASVKDAASATADADAARRRREANDRYFSRIQRGVVDVVDKLETVAQAMGRVERESREIWSSGSEDLDSSAA